MLYSMRRMIQITKLGPIKKAIRKTRMASKINIKTITLLLLQIGKLVSLPYEDLLQRYKYQHRESVHL